MKKFDPAELRRTKDRRQKEEGRMTRLHSYLNFAGTAEEAFGFYRSVSAVSSPRSSASGISPSRA